MSPATFFRASLLLPVALPVVLLPFGIEGAVFFLVLALAFGGIQYLVFAAWMFFAIGRQKDGESIQKLSFFSPLLFIPIQAIGWVAWAWYEQVSNPNITSGMWEPLLPFAFYTIVIGYLYVGVVNAVYWAFRWKGAIREHSAR